jgi:hypothetical protein
MNPQRRRNTFETGLHNPHGAKKSQKTKEEKKRGEKSTQQERMKR